MCVRAKRERVVSAWDCASFCCVWLACSISIPSISVSLYGQSELRKMNSGSDFAGKEESSFEKCWVVGFFDVMSVRVYGYGYGCGHGDTGVGDKDGGWG